MGTLGAEAVLPQFLCAWWVCVRLGGGCLRPRPDLVCFPRVRCGGRAVGRLVLRHVPDRCRLPAGVPVVPGLAVLVVGSLSCLVVVS